VATRGGPVDPEGPTPGSAADQSPDADPVEVARAICLRQLTVAPRTRVQLAGVLARRGVPADVSVAVLDRLGEVGLIDDGAYARAWVESRHARRGLSRRALAQELRQRGVTDDDAAAALQNIDGDRELAAARELVRRRPASVRRLEPDRQVRRLAGMLARKGYPAGVVQRVVREALGPSAEIGG
jgi:regulatory protein